jgi:hypothetical protein
LDFLRHPIPIRGRPCRNRANRPIAEILSCLRLIRIQTCPAYRSLQTRFGRIFQSRISAEIIAAAFCDGRESSPALDYLLLRQPAEGLELGHYLSHQLA